MKRKFTILAILLILTGSLLAQPAYYNFNATTYPSGGSNSFPLGITTGKEAQLLYIAGDFNQPSAAPSGTITSISVFISPSYSINGTYTTLTIKLGQASMTAFTSGAFYAGSMTTVYSRSSVTLSAAAGSWMTLTLDTPFPYVNSQALIVDIGHCAYSGASTWPHYFRTMSNYLRIWSAGGCPFAYSAIDASEYAMGITLTTSGPPIVVTQAATNVGSSTVTLNGTANANGADATVSFDYGTSTSYSSNIAGVPSTVTGTSVNPIYANVTGLTMGTLYHFRIKATNSNGTTTGSDLTFTTLSCNMPAAPGTISGSANVCTNAAGKVYSVSPITYATGYAWTVPTGAQITAGNNTNSITVTFGTTSGNITVNGTNTCGTGPTSTLAVTVNPIPVPTITGNTTPCVNAPPTSYTTETGQTAYSWTVSSGGTITAGSGTSQITVQWNNTGAQTVSVTYTSPAGCVPASPTVLQITVKNVPGAAGGISGPSAVCAGASGIGYSVSTIPNATSYVWTLPAGATLASGSGTNSITVNFAQNASSGNISVFGNDICGNGSASSLAITIEPFPGAAGTITGQNSVCQGDINITYYISPVANATGYTWTVPPGATITYGNNTDFIDVAFSNSAMSGNVNVTPYNSCGNGTASPDFAVSVNTKPNPPVIMVSHDTLMSDQAAGNQWYRYGQEVQGATGQLLITSVYGVYADKVTVNGCTSDFSNLIYYFPTGIDGASSAEFTVYPNPGNGQLIVTIPSNISGNYDITVFNALGSQVFEMKNLSGTDQKSIDLRPVLPGVYLIKLQNSSTHMVKRIVIN